MLAYFGAGRFETSHSFAKLALHAAAFFLAHPVQLHQNTLDGRQNRGRKFFFSRRGGGVECAWYAQHSIQIRFRGNSGFGSGRAKRLHVSCNEWLVQRKKSASALLEREVNVHVAARQFLFEN